MNVRTIPSLAVSIAFTTFLSSPVVAEPVKGSSAKSSAPTKKPVASSTAKNAGRTENSAPALAAHPSTFVPEKSTPVDFCGLPTTNTSLWYRYFSAGDDAFKKQDEETAKRYFFGALSELEKLNAPQRQDFFFIIRLSMLEQRMETMYKDDLAKISDDKPEKLKLKGEEVQVLDRIANINRKLVRRGNRLLTASIERSEKAREEFKTLSAKSAAGTAQPSGSADERKNGTP